jgi:beta-xylosidase
MLKSLVPLAILLVFTPAIASATQPAAAQAAVKPVPPLAVHAPGWPRVILPGDYPDPSILRDGDDYYLTHSPFYYTPGFLIWHSKDLVKWSPVTRAMTDVVGSAMAPDLVKVGGKYYLYFPAAGKNWVLVADDIRGPWSKPIRLEVGRIDPGHAVGEDGKRYLFVSAGGRVPLSDDGLSVAGKLEDVYAGWEYPADWKTEGMYLESPKIFRRGEYFYTVSAEGGTAGPATSHMVVVARAKSIHGPWENSPHNPLVHTYDAAERWWSKGHGTIVDDVNGNWWIVYHAYEKDRYPLGRQTLLDPVAWTDDGWPTLARVPHPLPAGGGDLSGTLAPSDDFSAPTLGLQWTTWRDYAGVAVKDGALVLDAKGSGPNDGRLLLVTATDAAYEVQVEVAVPAGGIGGLVLFYNEKAFAGISSDGEKLALHHHAKRTTSQPAPRGERLFLKIINRRDRCEFLAGSDGKTWTTLAPDVDVSGMHHNKFKGFLALRPGLMAAGSGAVKFDNFVYRALP